MRPTTTVLLAAACAAVPAIAAAGDKPPSPSTAAPSASSAPSASAAASVAPAPETADSLYNQGNDAYDHNDYALALALYSSAFKLRKSYDIARNLGLTELKLGKLRDAIGHFTVSLEQYPSNRADTKKQVVEWLAQAKEQVGKLRLTATPEGAACKINGAPISHEEREGDVLVDPGDTKIECGGVKGYGTVKRSLKMEKGGTDTLAITLPRGDTVDEAGPTKTGYSALPQPTRQKIAWTGLGLAVLAGVGGGVSGVLSIVKAGDADGLLADLRKSSGRDNPCVAPAAARCADLHAMRRDQDITGNVAIWMLLGASAVGAFTGAYLWPASRDTDGDKTPPRAASVKIAPGVGGVVLTGSF